MKKFEAPMVEVEQLAVEDVITTSTECPYELPEEEA
jgi:hypothetical protein